MRVPRNIPHLQALQSTGSDEPQGKDQARFDDGSDVVLETNESDTVIISTIDSLIA